MAKQSRWQRISSRLSQRTIAGLVAIGGLALVTLGPTGLALGWHERVQRSSEQTVRYLPGMELRDGAATFVVHEVRCGHDDEQAVHGRRCHATIGVRNDGAEPLTVPTSAQQLYSPEGVRHLPVSGQAKAFGTLDEGQSTTAVIEFDVPRDVEITHVGVHADPYSHGYAVSLPGPPLPLGSD